MNSRTIDTGAIGTESHTSMTGYFHNKLPIISVMSIGVCSEKGPQCSGYTIQFLNLEQYLFGKWVGTALWVDTFSPTDLNSSLGRGGRKV